MLASEWPRGSGYVALGGGRHYSLSTGPRTRKRPHRESHHAGTGDAHLRFPAAVSLGHAVEPCAVLVCVLVIGK